jgi:hypothetical protein
MFDRSELIMSCTFCRSLLECPRDVLSAKSMTAFENQTPLSLTFCDVSKAFDRVWIRGLIYKLEKYGMRGDILE